MLNGYHHTQRAYWLTIDYDTAILQVQAALQTQEKFDLLNEESRAIITAQTRVALEAIPLEDDFPEDDGLQAILGDVAKPFVVCAPLVQCS